MLCRKLYQCAIVCAGLLSQSVPVSGQVVETVGSRALGMAGAFTAVATDSSATWWNPAALAAGPFLDVALARSVTEKSDDLPVRRDSGTSFSFAIPPFGLSYYRLRITDIRPFDPTAGDAGNRQDGRAGVPVRSWAAAQLGITLVQTLVSGVHVGTTVKYVRGTVRTDRADGLLPSSQLLDLGDDLEGGDAGGTVELDAGLLAVAGPVRLGALIRNVRQAEVESSSERMRLPRQVRVGAAFDAERSGGRPFVVAIDVDVVKTATASGDRRNIAIGAERWLLDRRIGVRGGARFNTVGARERSAAAGVSAMVRAGLFLDAHVVRGRSADDRGWGAAARVSF
jgi:hypothetical protein